MRLLAYIAVVMVFVSCSGDRKDDCITSLGEDIVEYREVSASFTRLYVDDRVGVILVQDSSKVGRIELKGPEGVISQIESEVLDGEIRLTNNNTCNFVRSFDYSVEVKVFMSEIEEIHIESIATVRNEGILKVDNLKILNYALSDSHLALSGNEVHVQSINSAGTTLTGELRILKGSIEEVSELDASGLKCAEVLLDSHTALDCSINATEGIYVNLYNSGNIYYTQEPTGYKIVAQNTGAGRLLLK